VVLDTKQTNPPVLNSARPAISPRSGEGFCGARPPRGRAEQRFQIAKFLLAVKLYPLREPFSSGKQTDPPRHCLAPLGNTKEKCLLLFGFARARFFSSKRMRTFFCGSLPSTTRAGGGARILTRFWPARRRGLGRNARGLSGCSNGAN